LKPSVSIAGLCVLAVSFGVRCQTAQAPVVPDWALPGSATHTQVPPPAGFHRATRMVDGRIGIFEGQADVGGALMPGGASFDAATGAYTVRSAGYNIWYNRDEFRFLWKRMSGDVSLAADVSFPDAKGYGDRKAVLVIRQDLEDDSREALAAQHGGGLFHLAERAGKDAMMGAMDYRVTNAGMPGLAGAGLVGTKRIGIEKQGDDVTLWVSLEGETMHQFGPPVHLHFDGPFYVGIGFSSHQPATVDSAVLTHVVLTNRAGAMR
jgi:hypothetical protein